MTSHDPATRREGVVDGLSGMEALEAVRRGHIWILLQNPGRHVPGYEAMLTDIYREMSERIPGFEVHGDDADCYDNKTTYFDWKLVRAAEVIGPLGSASPYAHPLQAQPPARWTMELPYNNAVYETVGAQGAGWWTLRKACWRPGWPTGSTFPRRARPPADRR